MLATEIRTRPLCEAQFPGLRRINVALRGSLPLRAVEPYGLIAKPLRFYKTFVQTFYFPFAIQAKALPSGTRDDAKRI